MSLILEALKKSEARRQLGEAPGLGTPFTVARRRRSPLPLIVIGILFLSGLGWWFLRPRPAATATPATAATATAPGPVAAATPAPTAPGAPGATIASHPNPPVRPMGSPLSRAAAPPRVDANATDAPGSVNLPPRLPAGPNPATSAAAGSPPAALPGMATRAGAADSSAVRGAQRRPPAATPAPPLPGVAANARPQIVASGEGRPKPDARGATMPAVPSPGAQVVASGDGAPKPSAQPSVVASGTGASKPETPRADAAPKPAGAAPSMPLYYELPYNVRKDLPTLNMSMHVYAAVPAQRFVVVDGDRKAEGETIKDDVKLREIRPDGIVLEFRGQTFFYPRPGR